MSVHSESAAAMFLKRWQNQADLQWAVEACRVQTRRHSDGVQRRRGCCPPERLTTKRTDELIS